MQRVAQLTFDAFSGRTPYDEATGEPVKPLFSTIKLSGSIEDMGADGGLPQLDQGEEVGIVLTDADGQVIAQARGKVTLAFPEKSIAGMDVTLREHKVKLA